MERVADLVVSLHLAYAAFLVLGCAAILVGARAGWGWIRGRGFRITHLVAALVVQVEALVGAVCPLTSLERHLRERAGQEASDISFVGRIVRRLLFLQVPEWTLAVAHVAFGVLVVVLFVRIPPWPRRRSAPGAGPAATGGPGREG